MSTEEYNLMAGCQSETRLSHPSQKQVEMLLSYLENRLFLAKGLAKTQSAKERSKKGWYQISLTLNNTPGGSVKTVKRWMKYWSDKKGAVKKKQRLIEKSMQDGNCDDIPELSQTEERILALIKACSKATTAQLYRKTIKKEPIEQNRVESSDNNIVTTFLLERQTDTNDEDDNDESEVEYLSSYRLNDRTDKKASKQENHTPTVSSTRWGSIKFPPKADTSSDQSHFMMVAEKLCHIEQQRLDLDRRMLDVIERNSERDVLLAESVKAMGEGLKALAEAIARH